MLLSERIYFLAISLFLSDRVTYVVGMARIGAAHDSPGKDDV